MKMTWKELVVIIGLAFAAGVIFSDPILSALL